MTHRSNHSACPAGDHPLQPYLRPVYALCVRLVGDPTAAEDAAQETFLQAIQIWEHFSPPAEPPTGGRDPRLQWLLAIAARRALAVRRGRVRMIPLPETPMPAPAPTASDTAEQTETVARLEAALKTLPDEERQAILLHHVSGLTQAEVARAMDLPPRTVSHRIAAGLTALRHSLERQETAAGDAGAAPRRDRWATLSLLLTQLPAPDAPAQFAARLLAHPAILTWSASVDATAVSTASTGTTEAEGWAAATPDSVTTVATVNRSEGASIMSSKLTVAAAAALTGVLAAVFFWLPPTFAARQPAAASTPTVLSQPHATEPAPTEHPAEKQAPDEHDPDRGNGATTPDAAMQVDLERWYCQYLTAEQAATRAALLKAPRDPRAVDRSDKCVHILNTSVGAFEVLSHNPEDSGWVVDTLLLLPAAAGDLKPFSWRHLVMHAGVGKSFGSGAESVGFAGYSRHDSEDLGRSYIKALVTTTGELGGNAEPIDRIQAPENDWQFSVHVPTRRRNLKRDDVWPTVRPAGYDGAKVLERVGLEVPVWASLQAKLSTAQAADAAFLSAAQAWQTARAGSDPQKLATVAGSCYESMERLSLVQWAIAVELESHLREMQASGAEGWAMLKVVTSLQDGLQRSDRLTLDLRGQTLAAIAATITQHPSIQGSVTAAPGVAEVCVEGRITAESLAELITKLTALAKVDCRTAGENAWQLAPLETPPAGAEGF